MDGNRYIKRFYTFLVNRKIKKTATSAPRAYGYRAYVITSDA